MFNKKAEKPIYECKVCLDYGQVVDTDPSTGRKIFLPCPKCSLTDKEVQEAIQEVVNIFGDGKAGEHKIEDILPTKQVKLAVDDKFPINYVTVDMAAQLHKLGEVMEFGKIKYPKRCGWKEVPLQDWQDAIARHTHAYQNGEYLDPESGKPHLAHIALDCLVAMYHEEQNDS